MSDLPPPPPDDSDWSPEPPPPPPGLTGPVGAPPAGFAALGTIETLQLATPGGRLGARIIDIIIVGVCGFIGGLIEPFVVPIVVGAAYEIMFDRPQGTDARQDGDKHQDRQGRQLEASATGALQPGAELIPTLG